MLVFIQVRRSHDVPGVRLTSNLAYRVHDPQALYQNRVLRILCYPCPRYLHTFSHFLVLITWISPTVVRVRSREGRRNRAPPPRIRYKDGKKVNPAVQAAADAAPTPAAGAPAAAR
jgi:hypothetical protein